jgi:2-polyprenyl-3-methyl-5-hydroxy-6-metoxy-1,4-benzoquinol methylase
MIEFDFAVTADEIRQLEALPPDAWFTAVKFTNYQTPQLPALARLEGANQRKTAILRDWIDRMVPGRTVLDTFAANGVFSFYAAGGGATSVVGHEWDQGRVDAARLVASIVKARKEWPALTFQVGDVYKLADDFPEPFDVTMCLGGLYHIADPAYVLRQLRAVTTEHLILQTSGIFKSRKKNAAAFRTRWGDKKASGLTSIVEGAGKWDMTPSCVVALLRHGGFEVIEDRVDLPIYAAICRAV